MFVRTQDQTKLLPFTGAFVAHNRIHLNDGKNTVLGTFKKEDDAYEELLCIEDALTANKAVYHISSSDEFD